MLGFKLALVGSRPSSTPRCAARGGRRRGLHATPDRLFKRFFARGFWPSSAPRCAGLAASSTPLAPPRSRFVGPACPNSSTNSFVLAPPFVCGFPGSHATKGTLLRSHSWESLGRLSTSGRPGSSTPAGFARMEPALCRIPLPYPSPWRPRKSHDRARPGGEVVAPRVAAPSSCHTFRLFANVLGTEKLMVIKLSVAIAKSRRITILIFS